ncbi:MAG: hypothetical protein FVQ83_05585 [Chloroflexi bacterium]|nr:hypothetical protein [Chloroflexota bacterium]
MSFRNYNVIHNRFHHQILLCIIMVFTWLAAGCSGATSTATDIIPEDSTETQVPEADSGDLTSEPASTNTEQSVEEVTATTDSEDTTSDATQTLSAPTNTPYSPENWRDLPVIPVVSERAQEIYQLGLEMGNDPHAFSKAGDCQNVSSMFLAIYESPSYYSLGEYEYLQETIDWFYGSFSRNSPAVRGGMNVASVLSPLQADSSRCAPGENPLECEFNLHNPSIVIISYETWWSQRPAETYETYMREVIEYAISRGVVPIMVTKADNLEGDHSINTVIAMLAMEYEIPLWNFWLAVQPLPGQGMYEDRFHLTFAGNFFDDPVRMQSAWPWRNLTALQALDAVLNAVDQP